MMCVDKTITLSQVHYQDASARDITIPRELGPVRLIREIGRGGMGVVYLGWHAMLDRDVAVKFLLNAVAGTDDPGFKRFLDEGRAAAAVRHPALTVVYHADLIENIPYLVMEYVHGPALSEVIKQTGFFNFVATLAVLDPVIQAISELHVKEIIHRDIKPSNVLLDANAHVFVTDFGLACARPQVNKDASTPGIAGTPAYMAPEMFDGTISLQSDVYALGIMTFEMLTGILPFSGSLEVLREKHLHKPLPLELLHERRIDSALIEIVERATHKKEMFRYKSAEHFMRALRTNVFTDALLDEGTAELRNIVFKLIAENGAEEGFGNPDTPSTSTYFERLAELAYEKQAIRTPLEDKEKNTEESDQANLATSSIKPSAQDTDPPLAVNVSCTECEYNLRGLTADGRCPECGEPIASSLQPDRLLFANPKWLSTIALGQTLIFATMIAIPILSVVAMVVIILVRSTGLEFVPVMRLLMLAKGAIIGGGIAAGVFISTRPEPSLASLNRRTLTPRIALICALVGIPGIYAGQTVSSSTSGDEVISTTLIPFGEFVAPVGVIACIIGCVCHLLYLRKLAERVPDAKLAGSSWQVAILLCAIVPLGLGCLALNTLFLSFEVLSKAQMTFWFSIVIVGIPTVLTAVTVLRYWFLMIAYRRSMKRVIAVCVSYDTLFGGISSNAVLPGAECDIRVDTEAPPDDIT